MPLNQLSRALYEIRSTQITNIYIYYMEKSVLLGTKPLVDSIRHFIRDPSGNCTFFGMRPGKEQRDLCWGDLQLKTDSEGNCFIEFTLKDKRKRVPAKTLEILERRNLKCTKTRVTQIATPSTPTWLTKSTGPQA